MELQKNKKILLMFKAKSVFQKLSRYSKKAVTHSSKGFSFSLSQSVDS